MAKRIYRYFGAMIELQEKWLNSMSAKGYRLTKCSKMYYDFEECEPNEYNYQIDLVIDRQPKELDNMIDQLKNNGYNVFSKNISLNTVIGMLFFKSPFSFVNKFLNSPDIINKELLIIETVNNSEKFDLSNSDKIKVKYYKTQRIAYISYLILWAFLLIVQFYKKQASKSIIFILLAIIFTIPILIYQNHIKIASKRKSTMN